MEGVGPFVDLEGFGQAIAAGLRNVVAGMPDLCGGFDQGLAIDLLGLRSGHQEVELVLRHEAQVIQGEEATVHDVEQVIETHQFAQFYHVGEERLVHDTAAVDLITKREGGPGAIEHADVEMRQGLLIPVIAVLRQLDLGIGRNARHIVGQGLLLIFVAGSPELEESEALLFADGGKQLAAALGIQADPAREQAFLGEQIQIHHHISLADHVDSCRGAQRIPVALFDVIDPPWLVRTSFFEGDPLRSVGMGMEMFNMAMMSLLCRQS